MIWQLLIGAAIALVSCYLTGLTLRILKRRAILDHPNERSSHSTPIPRGGGIPVVALTIILWAVPVDGTYIPSIGYVLVGAISLAAISLIDDVKALSPASRLAVQFVAVGLGTLALPEGELLLQGLAPRWIDLVVTSLTWIWFINLFNFMDGIDGITSVETSGICAGLLILAVVVGSGASEFWLPLSLWMALLGFAWWNRPPARIFLGDVGSITLGFLLGWLLIRTAAAGYWASALILPSYYLADATITLVKRALRGEKVWHAHRQHYYQRAVQSGRSHGAVSSAILAANLILVFLAVAALEYPILALVLAGITLFLLFAWMRK